VIPGKSAFVKKEKKKKEENVIPGAERFVRERRPHKAWGHPDTFRLGFHALSDTYKYIYVHA
jgi:hypothetical protein